MSVPDAFDESLFKALGHPLRLRIIEALTERGEASPVALARDFGLALAAVSHHVRVLRDLGWIEISRTEPRRGAVEHFYRPVRRPVIDDEQWEQLPVVLRRGLASSVVRRIFGEASRASTTGGFDDPEAHIARMPLKLDARGRRELSQVLVETMRQADEIKRQAAARRASATGSDGDLAASELAILHFRLPHETTPREPAVDGRSHSARPPRLP
jgi:DNA-binding transcriptional ArsR family regulator